MRRILIALLLGLTTTLGLAADKVPNHAYIEIETTEGSIVVELNGKQAPLTVGHILSLVDSGFYDGTIFHRVIPNFMIQGGGMTEDMSQKDTREPIRNEAQNGEKNLRGTLAMARTNEIDSATSQFFINLRDNAFLDHGDRDFGYAVFGKVSEGMDVVDAIAGVATGSSRGHQERMKSQYPPSRSMKNARAWALRSILPGSKNQPSMNR